MIIVDASVAVKWLVDEPGSDAAPILLERSLAAPALWLAEVANALWRKCIRGDIGEPEVRDACSALLRAPVTAIDLDVLLPAAAKMAVRLQHPVYDCFYLAAAQHHDTHLVTADRRFLAMLAAHPDLGQRVRPLGG